MEAGGIERIKGSILSTYKAQASTILKEAQKRAEEIKKVAKEIAKKEEKKILAEAEEKAKSVFSQRTAQARLESRSLLLQAKNELIEKALEEGAKNFLKWKSKNKNDYKNWIKKKIASSTEHAKSPKIILIFSSSDKGLSAAFKSYGKIEFSDDMKGGVIVKFPEKKKIFDYSLEQILRQIRKNDMIEISKMLFGG